MTIALIAAVSCFVLGYLVGRVDLLVSLTRKQESSQPQGFFAINKPKQRDYVDEPESQLCNRIEIDERKVVSQISTDTIQKVTQIELGTKTTVADDVSGAAGRLAQLKGK